MNEMIGSGSASQQLGAAPGRPDGLPGNDGNEPEDLEFASSAEAELAPRDGVEVEIPEDYDTELSEDMINAIRDANANYETIVGVTDRDYQEGVQDAMLAQGLQGGNPEGIILTGYNTSNNVSVSAVTNAQTPNQSPPHAGGLSPVDPGLPTTTGRDAEHPVTGCGTANAFAGVAAEQPTGGGSTYAARDAAEQHACGGLQAGATLPSDLDAEEARLRRDIAALRQQRAEEQFWKRRQQQQRTVAHLRAEYEAMLR